MIELRCPVVYQFGSEGWQYYPGTNLAKSASGDVIGSRVYGFDYRGDRTREREYGTAAQASALGNDWTRSRVAGFNADGGLVRYAVYDKNNDNSLDTSLYAYGRDALGKKNFGATGRINVAGDTAWSAKRRYTWDGDWVVADSTEVGRRYYAYLGHRRIAELSEDTSGKWTSRAVLTDHLGTVTGIVGNSGTMEASYLLDPYGNLEHYAGKYQTLYLMTGKEYVSELAGYEFGARVYDPVMGMWWGRDPVLQYWTPYGSGNNPVNTVDPNGMLDYVFTSQDEYTTENDWGMFEFLHSDGYFVESDGVRYEANSLETIFGDANQNLEWNSVNTGNWFQARLEAALQNSSSNLQWVATESAAGGQMDQKRFLSPSQLFLYDGKLYNYYEAGNIVWGAAMAVLGFELTSMLPAAHAYSIYANGHLDQPNEVKSFIKGHADIRREGQ